MAGRMNGIWQSTKKAAEWPVMAILFTFLLGIGNFALHKAVIARYQPMLAHMQGLVRLLGGSASLAAEFAVLLVALLLVANGHSGWGWAYFGYSLFNGLTGWLILSRRV